jgi:protease-4
VSRAAKITVGIVVVLVGLYAVSLAALIATQGGGRSVVGAGASGTIGVLRLSGTVAADQAASLTSSGGIDPVATEDALRRADADDGIDAVVLRVNSPGGSPAASWEIYQAVARMRKPVVVSVADLTASGAYYFASAADRIVAAPTSEVGSIGVVLLAPDLEELFKKLGIRYTVLTKGKYKDVGSPGREMTSEEKGILLAQMDDVYERFIRDVAAGRKLDPDKIRALANGLTYPGDKAKALGLVDEVGSYRDAIAAAGRLAGLDPSRVRERSLDQRQGGGLLRLLLGADAGKVLGGLGQDVAKGLREGLGTAGGPELR